jgi:signal transduction histidine kinase
LHAGNLATSSGRIRLARKACAISAVNWRVNTSDVLRIAAGMVEDNAAPLILVVDDVAENLALARATLADEGFRVEEATNGEQAIAAVTRHVPDCVLMDIRMPGIDGITAAEQIRRLPGADNLAIIFVTAQREVIAFDRAIAAGGDDFITKPYRPDELVIRVRTAMRLRRLAAERGDLVAELKAQRDYLQRLELQKEQLVAFVVHDFKNPVNSIELQATRVLRKPDDAQRAADAATRIKDEARTLLRLITNLLDISRADEQRLAPARQTIDANELVQSVVEELRTRATDAEIQLTADVAVVNLHADRDLLHRVLANLVDNAIRHSPQGSQIRVGARVDDNGVELVVADAGPGVPAEERDAVFDRYHRGQVSGSTNRGLGLAFCKVAVEAHGGTIRVEDGAPGAVFLIRLPRE